MFYTNINTDTNESKYIFGLLLLKYVKSVIQFAFLCEESIIVPQSIKERIKNIIIKLIYIVTIYTEILKKNR